MRNMVILTGKVKGISQSVSRSVFWSISAGITVMQGIWCKVTRKCRRMRIKAWWLMLDVHMGIRHFFQGVAKVFRVAFVENGEYDMYGIGE